jgi:hypothetical protein
LTHEVSKKPLCAERQTAAFLCLAGVCEQMVVGLDLADTALERF